MRVRGFLLLSVFVILLGLSISKGLANGVQPEARTLSPEPTKPKAVPPTGTAQAKLVSLNFTGADLVEVIHVLAQHLKINYTIDPAVKGTVTVYSAEPLKRDDLFPIFHQILRMNKAVAVKTGNLYRIAPLREGKGLARPVRRGGDSYALQVVPVRFFSVVELK
ncbi:MAG: hypothetical protein ACE5JU_09715, partial [Candidatus Binatia bacterium]